MEGSDGAESEGEGQKVFSVFERRLMHKVRLEFCRARG